MNSHGRGVPLIYYPLIILAGFGTSICLYCWFRQYALFFGWHMLSVTTILCAMLVGMATGSRIIGRIADKFSGSLILFIVLEMVAGIYGLLHPHLFAGMKHIFQLFIAGIQPGPFGIELSRIALSLVFLLVPMFVVGGTVPALSRNLIKSMPNAGYKLSNIFTAGAAGMLMGLLATVFILIPDRGFNKTLLIGSLFFVLTGVLATVFLVTGLIKKHTGYTSTMARRVRRTTIKFRKNRNVLEIGVKLTRITLRVQLFQGFLLASLLVICYRIISDFARVNPVHLFALIVGTMLAGIIFGTFLYKWIAEKPANSYLLFASLTIFTGLASAASMVAFGIFPGIYSQSQPGTDPGILLLFNHLKPILILLFVPALLLGLAMPVPGKIYPRRLQKSGTGIGRLGTVYLLGMILGLLITPYLIIPLAGTYRGYFLLILLTLLAGMYLLLRDSRLKRVFRLGYSLLVVSIFTAVVVFLPERHLYTTRQALIRNGLISDMHEGSTGSVRIYPQAGPSSMVSINGRNLFSTDEQGMKIQLMPVFLPVLLHDNIRTGLVSGFGTGITASTLASFGVPSISITEFYPEMVTLTSHVFSEQNDDILTGAGVDITIEDTRSFLLRTGRKFDIITSGTSMVESLPHLYTVEYYKACLDNLNDQGLLCQVIPAGKVSLPEFKSLIKSCMDVFPNVSLWFITPEQFMLLAGKSDLDLDYCRLVENFDRKRNTAAFEHMGIRSVESLIAHLILDDAKLRSFAIEASENSDNRPSVEFSFGQGQKNDLRIVQRLSAFSVNFAKTIRFKASCAYNAGRVLRETGDENRKIWDQLLKEFPD
jgi:spermidine synthase